MGPEADVVPWIEEFCCIQQHTNSTVTNTGNKKKLGFKQLELKLSSTQVGLDLELLIYARLSRSSPSPPICSG